MKILAQRPTHISAVATVLLITKTFTVKREREGGGWRGVGGREKKKGSLVTHTKN